ncbi:MAG TPA: ATP-binding protein [Clostridium sp.]|uniref:ATP-binding protein n=1 Tax=Clostridium sp. TaxID=1506 RepID=UPI002F941ACC
MLQQDYQQEPTYIIESKKRCFELGMNPNESKSPKNIMSELKLTEKKETYKDILEVVKFFSEKIIKSLEGTPIIIVISDENGYLLDTLGDETIKSTMTKLGIRTGIQFSEDDMGTNVVSLTLKQNHPVQLIGTNHFHTFLHNSACYGVPFHYTDINNILGSICIMTSVILHNPFFLLTLTTVVDAIERELLLRNQNDKLNIMNQIMLSKTKKIEEQKKELEAIIEIVESRNEFLDRLIYNLELPVISLSSPDLKILQINQRALNIIKKFMPHIESAKQIRDTKISDIITNFLDDEYLQKINEVITEKKIKYINKKIHLINGDEIYWNVIFEPVFELNGEIQEILMLIIDITTEIKSNKIMEKALESQEEFLANISHELKTPLNVIYSTIQLFNMYCKNGSLDKNKESIFKYINSMMQNCYRLSKLINNIVDLSKIEAGFFELNLSNYNIVEIVEEIVNSVAAYTDVKGLDIIFDTDIEEKIIACDPEKIERILLNLISNAIKFSDEENKIFVNVKDKNELIEISVRDNGIGIERNELDMIFNRFRQVNKSLSRNAEGTGIGLSLVKAIVELHQGSIHVESEIGKGSTFTVYLPTRKVNEENIFISNTIRNKKEDLQVELSDIF